MGIGAFSLSLAVEDIHKSKVFYEALGFEAFHGDIAENWLIMKNDDCVIGLFQGMFDSNIMTFNPGWNNNAEALEEFTDIRDLQKELIDKGISFVEKADPQGSGPASFMIKDPDGNTILVDQHV
ncbi:VOC family protein [Alkalibacter mobilis]|uniref:VOC family protein n=1 Tax=Alkalibacter mobilis TaxID=2787712 RepID=UPI00189DF8E6|nr:VOC family protein [Alkalibacter mobilis]MBF7096809.1 VOC family protein [Alkalibacter mobilis]